MPKWLISHRLNSEVRIHFRVDEGVLDQLAYFLQNARYPSQVAVPAAQTNGKIKAHKTNKGKNHLDQSRM